MMTYYKKLAFGAFGLMPFFLSAANEAALTIPANLLVYSGLSTIFVAKFALFITIFLSVVIAVGYVMNKFLRMPVIAGQIIGGIL